MKIAIYGREFNNSVLPFVQDVFNALQQMGIKTLVYKEYYDFIEDKVKLPAGLQTFSNHLELRDPATILISLGGDGTLLDTLA